MLHFCHLGLREEANLNFKCHTKTNGRRKCGAGLIAMAYNEGITFVCIYIPLTTLTPFKYSIVVNGGKMLFIESSKSLLKHQWRFYYLYCILDILFSILNALIIAGNFFFFF